jgi:Zn-dependent protease with chaperone function
MERAQFVETVRKLEEYAQREPEKYRRRVGLLAALGYGYILLILAVALAMLIGLMWIFLVGHRLNVLMIKVGIFLLIFTFIVLRSLLVKFSPPEGIELSCEQVPEIFAMVDDLTAKLASPRFHHVLLNDEFNASVMQLPRLGILGWQKNYLILGLPLMQALTAEEFRAVVAHEFGHLSGNHGRFGGWIYRIHLTWDQLRHNLAHSESGGSWIFEKFFSWYAPYFGAYSFVLRRADEYVADRCAADMTSPRSAASALVSVNMKGRYLEEVFWPGQFKLVKESATPPTTPFSQTAQLLHSPFTSSPATAPSSLDYTSSPPPLSRWLSRAFQDKTDYADTHPCLADRLAAMGFQTTDNSLHNPAYWGWKSDQQMSTLHHSAAEHYLGAAQAELTRQLDEKWHKSVVFQWEARHKEMQEGKKRLQELQQKSQDAPLSKEELWEQITLTHELESGEAALPLAQKLLEIDPKHAAAHFALGQMLLDQEDEAGIEHLLRACELETDATLAAYGSIYHFLSEHGRVEEAEKYRDKSYDFQDTFELAMEERAQITERDEFLAPALSPELMQKLLEFLHHQKGVAAAYLVRKKVQHMENKPVHILAVTKDRSALIQISDDSQALVAVIIGQLEEWEDNPINFVFITQDVTKKIWKKIEAIPESKIYPPLT